MQNQFTVIFDSCVLYPAQVRDLLIELASRGLFRGRWTNQIHEEWIQNLLENRPDLKKDQLERTRDLMNMRVLDCLISDYESLINSLMLPDSCDNHVLAAAIKGHAQIIVTYNLKDFPKDYVKEFGIEVQHPDTFLRFQIDLNLSLFLSSVKTIRERLRNPPLTSQQYLQMLSQHLPHTVSFLSKYVNLI